MKKEDKIALKLIKKKFTLQDWESFDNKIKNNSIILLEVNKMISNLTLEKKKEFINKNPQTLKLLSVYEQEILANKDNFIFLSNETQNKMISKNDKLIKFASDDVKKEKTKENPYLLCFLNEKDQCEFINDNKFLIPFASEETQIKLVSKNINLLSLCKEKVQLIFLKENPNYYRNCNYHLQKNLITLKMLDFNKITVDTLNTYLLVKGAYINIDELIELKSKINESNREDKQTFGDYLNYLIVNFTKKELI